MPEYHVKDSGPDHQKLFLAVVKVGGRELGVGEGRSKKAAEQLAAEAAYRSITRKPPPRKTNAAHAAERRPLRSRAVPAPPAAGTARTPSRALGGHPAACS